MSNPGASLSQSNQPGGQPATGMRMAWVATIVGLICGGVFPVITGVVALVMAYSSESAWQSGNAVEAANKGRSARTWTIVTWVLTAIGLIFVSAVVWIPVALNSR
jgi:heme/copper-type cytochrome/quinol oxidase subunit 2